MSPFGIDAIVVNTVDRGPRQMLGMGDSNPLLDLANSLTGGKLEATQNQLDRLELFLKISIGASIVAGGFALVALVSGKGR